LKAQQEESASFWKKKQKLLSIKSRAERTATPTDKSFLVLFFKKELRPCLARVLFALGERPETAMVTHH